MSKQIIVIKVGSALLLNEEGKTDESTVQKVIDAVVCVKKNGHSPILITSGAVANGSALVGKKISKGTRAAIGQPILMHEYQKAFSEKNIISSQYLITREDFSDRKRYICLKSSLEESLFLGILPIINDNDVLHEARESFSDNDQLACYIGVMMGAQKVIIMTSVDGIYTNFGTPQAKRVDDIFDEKSFDAIDTKGKTDVGTGGMEGKIQSIKTAMNCGVDCFVVSGKQKNIIEDILAEKKNYTHIHSLPADHTIKGIQKWLLAGATPKAEIEVSHQGAIRIHSPLERKSLLAKGVTSFTGNFEKGDVVSIRDEKKSIIGYGVAKISSENLKHTMGSEHCIVVHADYLLLL